MSVAIVTVVWTAIIDIFQPILSMSVLLTPTYHLYNEHSR